MDEGGVSEPARASRWTVPLILLLLIVIAGLAGAFYWQVRRTQAAEEQAGLHASQVLAAIFTQAQDLRVATLRGTVKARSSYDGTVFDPEQITVAPYRASYFIDLAQVDRSSYRWDAERRTMEVRIPDVTVDRPAIDYAEARVRQNGVWISRRAGQAMQRQAATRMTGAVAAEARSDKRMAEARAAAVVAVQKLIRPPLAAAGFADITVTVLYPWQTGGLREDWDRSRSLEDVYANRSG